MQYPLISEYVRAIQDASSNLDRLAYLVPVLDDHGEPRKFNKQVQNYEMFL